ncbi:hypothetical protein V502_07260 [Pseudogymnoascus sp. VKM F-4520 (FW-2644)]|nr:hypothetical protein V502_07260 [Pseudogymnoascus sp. VKM F-4520 (FW-2644)]
MSDPVAPQWSGHPNLERALIIRNGRFKFPTRDDPGIYAPTGRRGAGGLANATLLEYQSKPPCSTPYFTDLFKPGCDSSPNRRPARYCRLPPREIGQVGAIQVGANPSPKQPHMQQNARNHLGKVSILAPRPFSDEQVPWCPACPKTPESAVSDS